MSAIKKFVDNEWRIFSATDAVNISTVFPGYRTTIDATYQPDTIYYWCYRSDKKLTTDVAKMVAGIDYKVGEAVGRVYFPEAGSYKPYNIDPECILVNSHYSVHDVLARHDDEIQLLKRNVSWLALHGGGGGGGGGSSHTTKATCKIYVNDKASVGSDGYVINKSGMPIKITLANFNIETNKKWTLTILADSTLITTQQVSWTNPTYTLPYSYIQPYVVNHKLPNFIVQASYEDDDSSIYGYSEWVGNLVDATVTLTTQETQQINFEYRNQTTMNFTYATGITHYEDKESGDQKPVQYTLTVKIEGESLTNPIIYTREMTIETGSGSWQPHFSELLEEGTNGVPFDDQKPGSYSLTSTLSAEYEGQLITSEEVKSNVALLSNNAIYVSKYLSTVYDYPTSFSSDSKLNVKYIVYKNNESVFDASYYVVTLTSGPGGHTEKEVIATLAEHTTERLGELISYSFPTTAWRGDYVGTNEILAVKSIIQTTKAEPLIVYSYFKINKGADNYITLSQTGELSTFVDFHTDEYATAQPDEDYITLVPVQSWQHDHNPVNGKLYIPNKNNKTWIVEDPETKQPSLRISNGVYAYLEDFFVGASTSAQTFKSTIDNLTHEWTVSICYKSDYHPDDNRTILSCGTYNEETNTLATGFSINAHGIYLGGDQVARLTDSVINTVDITCAKTNTVEGDEVFAIKVFVNGVLTAVTTDSITAGGATKVALGDRLYIGGRPATLECDDKFLCDCNIYTLRLFTTPLSDLDILSNYINNRIITSYFVPAGSATGIIDPTVREAEENKNLCQTVSETNRLKCDIYSNEGGYSINGFLDNNGYLSASKLDTSQAKALGVPIVLVDVSNATNGWTFDQYHTVGHEPQLVEGRVQYWDPTSGSTLIDFNADVTTQGTSSLEYPTKNIDITLANTDFFIPRADWLPESTYTIKVDMMDSAHSNNASIGKTINTLLGYDKDGNCKFFPADDKAIDAVYNTIREHEGTTYDYHSQQQPLATLKHTVEGFPIFLIMRFKTDEGGQTIPIGIGSFNLGRKAIRNLGFSSLTYIKDDKGQLAPDARAGAVSYPFIVKGGSCHEIKQDCEWIETRTLHNNLGMSAIDINSATLADGYPKKFSHVDPQTGTVTEKDCKYDADFWQPDGDIVRNYSFAVEYQNARGIESDIMNEDFVLFNQTVARLPIECLEFSQIKNTVKNDHIKGKYPRLKYNATSGGADPDGGFVEVSNNIADFNTDSFTFDYQKLYYYFIIAMLFGLVDNFGKNVSYRRWNKLSASGSGDDWGKYYADFYDLDTALGLSNTGKETVEPDVWFKYLDNTEEVDGDGNPLGYGYVKECYYEDSGVPKTETCSNNVVSSFDNKLWMAIDTQFFRQVVGQTGDGSNYSNLWWQLRAYLDKYVRTFNDENHTNYNGFVDFFTEEFFAKQTGSCGSIIFNYDYRLKYLMQFSPTDTSISTTWCVYIHGRRIDYVRQWLKNHVLFLDTVFYWRDATKFGMEGNIFKNNIDSFVKFTVDGSQQEPYPLKSNSPIIMRSQVANNIDTYYWMKKNAKTYTNSIFNTSSPISLIYYNSPTLIEIGDKATPMAYLKVNEMLYNIGDNALDAPGLPSLTGLDLSTATSFTSEINTSIFSTGKISELRTIDFSGTKNSSKVFPLDLKTSGKFTKITDIDISSSCITQLSLPNTPLLTLNVTNSPITSFELMDQKYLKDISFEGCTNLQSINIQTCYSYDKVVLDQAKNLKSVVVADCHNIKVIELTDCPKLDTVEISNCPNLEVIKITNATNLYNHAVGSKTGLQINTIGSLVELNVKGCKNLTFIELNGMTSGEKLRTLDISETKVSKITGDCGGIEFLTQNPTDTSHTLLDLVHFTNLGYTPSPARKDAITGNTITEQFACYWNTEIDQIRFANSKTQPIRITQPFRSCGKLSRIFGHVILAANPAMNTISGTSVTGLFNGNSNFSVHGTNASTWLGQNIKTGSVYNVAWELATLAKGGVRKNSKEEDYDNISYDDVFARTTDTNRGLVTNIRFANASNIVNRTFQSTAVTQFDVYYLTMMLGLSDCVGSTVGSMYETFNGGTSKFTWLTATTGTGAKNTLVGNQPSPYLFYRLDGKISGMYNIANTGYTYLKSPEVGYYYKDGYDSAATYNRGDVVTYNSKTYNCKIDGTKNVTPTISANWSIINEYTSSNTYTTGSFVTNGSNLYICCVKEEVSGAWDATKWRKIEANTFFVAKDNGIFSPIPNVSVDRPFSGSAVHSKWLWRRLCGNYNQTTIHFHDKLVVDIDKGRIFGDDGLISSYVDFTDPNNYNSLADWGGETLPMKTVNVNQCVGNFDGFFDNLVYLTTIYNLNSHALNFDKLVIPKTVTRIGGDPNSGVSAFDVNIARGFVDFTKMFPAANNLQIISNAFFASSSSSRYVTKGTVEGKAQMPIGLTPDNKPMFQTLTNLTSYGRHDANYSYYTDCFTGAGIRKYIPMGVDPADWDGLQATIFDPIAAKIETMSNFLNGLESVDGWTSKNLAFPGTFFLKCTKLLDVHKFMANCKQPYHLTSDGFRNCPSLRSVRQVCYYDIETYAHTTNSTLEGEIPYRFFYHGFLDQAVTVYGSNNATKPNTSRLTGKMDEFTKNTIKTYKNQLLAGNHDIKFNNAKLWLDDDLATDFGTTIATINNCNMTIDSIEYNGTAVIKLTKASGSDTYTDAAVTITGNKVDHEPDDETKTITLEFELDDTIKTIHVENACKTHVNDVANYRTNIVDMYECFYGCNNITPYDYANTVDEIASHTKIDPHTGTALKLDKSFMIMAKNADGDLVEREIGRLERNPEYNPYKWIYNTTNDTWEENIQTTTLKEYSGYWSYNGNIEYLKIKRDNASDSVIYDNTPRYAEHAFLERFDIVDVPSDLDVKGGNTLAYCCAPDLFRYTNNAASGVNITYAFYNCGCYAVTVARGITGRICPYLLKPLSNITNIGGLFRNCRRLSSYKYGHEEWNPTEDTTYQTNHDYYLLNEDGELPTIMVQGVDFKNGEPVGTIYVGGSATTVDPERITQHSVVYDDGMYGRIYQIPDTFFNWTLNISTVYGAFSGLIFLYNTKLDIFDKISAKLENIISVYAACHFAVQEGDSFDPWIISGTFSTLKVKYASGAFSLAFLSQDLNAQYYVSDPTSTTYDCYATTGTTFNKPGDKLGFLDNFNATRMGNAVGKTMYTWYKHAAGVSISERSGVNISKTGV